MTQQLDVNSPTSVSEEPQLPRSKRRAMFGLQSAGKFYLHMIVLKRVDNFLTMLEYATAVWPRKKRTPLMDVDQHVATWIEAVLGLTLAHDKKTIDEWEHKMNDLLEPFLKCPVKQIREFCTKLVAGLEADPRVPYMVKHGVAAYVKIIVGNAKDNAVIDLKKDIAMRIAKSVEGDVQPQLAEAMTNALMWRDPETLERIEKGLKRGTKARITGRESCLFLEVGNDIVML